MIVCAAPNPSIDKLFVVDRLAHGEVHRPQLFIQLPGGKGINVARAIDSLGDAVRVVALVGGHTGRWVVEALEREGLRGRFVWGPCETRASLSVADRQTDSLTDFYESGEPLGDGVWERFAAATRSGLGGARWLALSGSLPLGAPDDGYVEIVRDAAQRGVATAVDAREEGLATSLRAQPDVVKINDAEAAQLVGRPVESRDAALAAARELRELAGGEGHAMIVTRGVQGAVMIAPDGSAWDGRLDAFGPYPVGSGDAFLGGLLSARDRGEGWRGAFAVALAAGSANAEQPGPGRIDRARVVELAARAEVRPLA